jgi:Fe-S oxidoreductase
MLGIMESEATRRRDYSACSGCSLCLLVCPVWRETRDLRLTPHGRAKAMQHGAGLSDIAASVESCTLCAACEPVCPENIDLVGMILSLRAQLPRSAALQEVESQIEGAA